MTESCDYLTCANKLNVGSHELDRKPSNNSEHVPSACMWVGGGRVRVTLPIGTRDVRLGHLRGLPGGAGGEWLQRRRA